MFTPVRPTKKVVQRLYLSTVHARLLSGTPSDWISFFLSAVLFAPYKSIIALRGTRLAAPCVALYFYISTVS